MSHTPAPWNWDSNPINYDPEQEAPWIVSEDGKRILTGTIKCHSEDDANVIAAAADSHEANIKALKAMQSVLCDPEDNPCFDGSDADRQVIRDAMRVLKSAINKARGA